MDKSTLRNYISEVEDSNTEHSKAYRFLSFVENIFGEEIDIDYAKEVFPEFEKYLVTRRGAVAIRGRAGVFPENLIIEFKADRLDSGRNKMVLERAKNQLRRYIYVIWKEYDTKLKYLLLASDGIRNYVYRPILKGNLKSIVEREGDYMQKELDKKLKEVIELEKIDEMDISKVDPDHLHSWFNRYFLNKK